MSGRKRREIAAPLARGRDRFRAWRRTRNRGSRIPDPLWKLAAKLAQAHGVAHTASILGLDYYALKERVESTNGRSASTAPAFVELASPPVSHSGECIIELEDGVGGIMRVRLKGHDLPDLLALSRSFWNGE